ncbi:unnamed protein product [Rotaria sp. Silwood2]|nr:unnamed protein product [Rotaria sp. Silwood2]CAF4403668.1 unnamed protein product [Rotaria sp. Silwood2]CAF4406707.1 unnamed protein product [Rotaria sp. Silwood2]
MYKTEDDHLHQESRSIGINQQSKEVICELFKMKIKPKRMLELLEEKGLPVPKKQQLSNYLTSLREKCYGTSTISLGELEAWYEINNDDDDDNVSNDDDDKNKFRFFVTTKRLLFNASISNKIHVDATYNCICDGLRNLNLQMNEQELVLIADGAEAISNAFSKDFGTDHNIVMCWFHMRKRVEKKLNLVEDKALHNEIMNDIETSQLSKNNKTFNIATRLF